MSFLFGVLNFFFSKGYLVYYIMTIVGLGGISYLIDIFRVKKVLRNNVFYIERRFLCLSYKYYYKYLFYKVLLTFLCLYLVDTIFNIESYIYTLLVFFCIFIIIYINTFPIFFVKISKRLLQLYVEVWGSNDIYIKAYNKDEVHCFLRFCDLKRISAYV